MADLGNTSELEAELISRNRQIAKVRDEVLKLEKRLEESQLRNDDLLEKNAELDADVTTKTKQCTELEEKVTQLDHELATVKAELETTRKDNEIQMEAVRSEFEARCAEGQQDLEAQDELKSQLAAVTAQRDELARQHDEEQRKHADTKVALESSGSSSRDMASKSVDHRRKLKELEDALKDKEDSALVHVASVDQERAAFQSEILNLKGLIEEKDALNEDLMGQISELENEHAVRQGELEDLRNEHSDHHLTHSDLKAQHDEALQNLEDLKKEHEENIKSVKKMTEDQLHRAMAQAAQLDGRLGGQRIMLDEANASLARSEEEGERLRQELEKQKEELAAHQDGSRRELEEAAEKASNDLGLHKTRYESELESERVIMNRQAKSEIDEANRAQTEAEEKVRRLEQRVKALQDDHEEAQGHHGREKENLRNQHTEMRGQHAEALEHNENLKQEVERHKKDLDDAKKEAERLTMAHKQEQERFQQTLEAEGQSRDSADKINQSQLEEKDTLIEHRNATIERHEADLADAKVRIEELEESVTKAKEDSDSKAHSLGVRNASLERELHNRQQRLTEVEGRLEAQRQYLEQLNETLQATQTDRETLMQAKGSLETQLKFELSHKDAVTLSLQQSEDAATQQVQELEERILRDREAHREAMEDVKRQMGAETSKTSERLAAVEAELLTARQRCELLVRNKADLQLEVGQQREKQQAGDAELRESKAEQERLSLELDQARDSNAQLDGELTASKQDRTECDAKIKSLVSQVRSIEEQHSIQRDDYTAKIMKMDDLLHRERELRETLERSLSSHKDEHETTTLQIEADKRRVEQDLRSSCDSWRHKSQDLEVQLGNAKEQIESMRRQVDEQDARRRESETQLRGEVATNKAKITRLEADCAKKDSTLEDSKAKLAQQQSQNNIKIAGLERQLEKEFMNYKNLVLAKEAVEKDLQSRSQGSSSMQERLGMAAEELFTRQINFALDKQRLSGALEESRRTLRNSLGVPNPIATVDSARVQGLEQQLSELRRKSIEQVVALQRAERRCNQLEATQKRTEEQRSNAAQQSREADRKLVGLNEEIRKAKAKVESQQNDLEESRERGAMASAELGTQRYESKYEAAKLRGALDELRYMLKMQEAEGGGRGGYPMKR